MRWKKLLYNNKEYYDQKEIDLILFKEGFKWLVDSEVEFGDIEIKKNTIIWNDGIFYSGNWYYGIFRNGTFYGKFENGIFENGDFKGTFISGIR